VGFALVQGEGISEDVSATLQAHYSGSAGNASSNSWGITVSDAGEVEGSLNGDFVAVTEELDGDPITRLVGTEEVEVVQDGELYFDKDADGNLRAGTTESTQRPIFNEAGEVVGYEQIPSNDLMVTDNLLFGTAARDRINGLTGNDALVGDAGADELDGGVGNDLIAGGAGSDVIKGGSGNDIISSAGDLSRTLQQLGPGDLWDDWGKLPGSPVLTQGTTWGAHGTVVRLSGSFNNEQFFRQGDMDGDLIDAGAGDDFVAGSDGPDAVKSGVGNDAIAGRGGDDVLEGGDDNDVIEGDSTTVLTSSDRLWTPASRHGNDFLDGGAGNDVLWGNGGNDQLFGGTDNDALLGDDSEPSNPWTPGTDHHGQDYLDGEDGNDSLVGGGRDDVLYGGIGDDDLLGDDRALTGTRHGNDYLDGQDGNDLLVGGGGADRLYGGANNDVLHGDDDLEHLSAEFHGDDYLDGGSGSDTLVGGGGNDVLVGGAGQDYLVGGDGDDYYAVDIGDAIMDTGGTNTISMMGGEPVRITVEGKNLVMHFGSGGGLPQLATLDGVPMTEDVGEPLGTVLIQNALEGGDFELNGALLNDEWFGTYDVELTTTADDQQLSSWAGNDTLTALHNAATLSGGAGNNVLKGGAGDDTLISSGGVDQLTGGGGDDTFQITAQAGVVSIATGAANAGFGHDKLVLPGSANDTTLAVTTEGADAVITTVRRVVQDGGAVQETPGPTVRLVGLFANGAGQAPADSMAAIHFADGTSVSLQDVLASGMTGGPADDVLSGSLLADVMDGGGGNDQLLGYAGNDTLLGGEGDDQLDGGSGQDSLEGGAGNDILTGGYGSDVMRGGAGDDVYVFGADDTPQLQNDVEAGQQVDVIYDTEGTNTIEFGDGVNLAAIGYVKVSDTVSQYFYNGHKIEVHGAVGDALIRANGSVVPPATLAVTGGTSVPDESLTLAQQAFFAQHESAAKAAITEGVLAGAFILQHTNASTALWQSLTTDEPSLSNISLVRNEVITTQHFGALGYRDANGNTVTSNFIGGQYPLPLQGANPVQALQAIFDSQSREITVTSAAPAAIERVKPPGGGAVTWDVIAWSWTGRDNSLEQVFGDYTVTNTKTSHEALAAHVLLGDSDNGINLGAGVVHAGAGNDTIVGHDNWYYPASEGMKQLLLSGITANYLDGGDGNDTIRGSELNDVIVGGRGRDVLDGHRGSDRYLVLDYGVGSGDEDIITDLAFTYTGPLPEFSAPLDADVDVIFPQTSTTDLDIDVVEFGPGISLAQVDFLREPDADDPSGTGWLVVLMQGRRLASIKLAEDDAPGSSGIEILAFHGGQSISMANAMTLANTVLPLVVGELTGVQTLEDGDFQYEVGGQISGGSGALTVSASLADGSALPSWLTFDAPMRSFHGSLSNAPAGTLTVRLTVTDATGQSTVATFPIVVEGVNDAPYADVPLGEQYAVLGQALQLQLDAQLFVDVDAGDALGWQVRQADGSPLPAWLGFDPATRTLTGTPGSSDLNALALEVIVTDQAGASASQGFLLVVHESDPAYVYGTSGPDNLYGDSGNNILVGGAGDDTLFGREGNDVYLFRLGDGSDLVVDSDSTPGNVDTIRFDATVLPSQVRVTRDFDSMALVINGTNDRIQLSNWFSVDSQKIERVEFADGTVWDEAALLSRVEYIATPGDDFLLGTPGPDTLEGLGGDDELQGGAGNDVYLFGRGMGYDWIQDYDEAPGNIDTLRLDATVLPGDVTLTRTSFHEVTLRISGTDDVVGLSDWLLDDASKIERVEFENGTVWNVADIQHRIVNATATDGPDTLIGYMEQDDALDGGVGDDALFTGSGNDTLTGGRGNDTLDGDEGQDTYLFSRGDGVDNVYEWSDEPGNDVVRFDATVGPGDMHLSRDTYNLHLHNAGSGDQIVLANWFVNDLHVVEEIQFADGTTLGVAAIQAALDGSGQIGGNRAPVAAQAQPDQEAVDDEAWSLTLPLDMFSDADAGDTLSWQLVQADGQALPSWLAFDAATRTVAGTPPAGESVALTLQARVTDSHGAVASQTFKLTVGEVMGLTIVGTAAADNLVGTAGNDTIDGLGRADTMTGAAGNDWYAVDNTRDQVIELADQGYDHIQASVGYTLPAHVEALTLLGTRNLAATGNALANLLVGNSGANRLDGAAGADTMRGDAGNDVYVVDDAGDSVTELTGQGTDTVLASVSYTLPSQVERLTLAGSQAGLVATGNDLSNLLVANAAGSALAGLAGNDVLRGADGADTLLGGDGNDRLEGNAGADQMAGGAGNDVYLVDDVADGVWELAGEGTDTVLASVSYTLGGDVERLTLTGLAELTGTGNALNNLLVANAAGSTLVGLAGNDTLRGGTGKDVLLGGEGNDVYVVNSTDDVVTELAGEGTDTVQASVSLALGAGLENLTLTGTQALDGMGNDANNTLTGNAAANTLLGMAGNDTLRGNAGNDALQGGEGNDRLDGGAGADQLVGGTGNDVYVVDDAGDSILELAGEGTDTVQTALGYMLGNELENLTITGTNVVTATGNALNNVLNANDAGNTLRGLAGNDTLRGGDAADMLEGGTGNDRLEGGKGGDTYLFARGDAADTLVDNDATAGAVDVLKFAAGIDASQLWWRKAGNNLEVSVIGTTDKVTVSGWYLSPDRQVEVFELANGQQLLNTEVQALVQAMAAYTPPAQGQVTLVGAYETNLGGLIATAWG
jgi:Ca2+-binding RTX toxin-like protein